MEATVCCQFYYWSEVQVVWKTIIMQRAYTSAIERSLLKWMGLTATVQWRNWVLLLSCDNTLKFDWYCQFSATEVTQKFPGHFSYSLGTRLDQYMTGTPLIHLPLRMEHYPLASYCHVATQRCQGNNHKWIRLCCWRCKVCPPKTNFKGRLSVFHLHNLSHTTLLNSRLYHLNTIEYKEYPPQKHFKMGA